MSSHLSKVFPHQLAGFGVGSSLTTLLSRGLQHGCLLHPKNTIGCPFCQEAARSKKNCIVGTLSFVKREFPMSPACNFCPEACTGKTLPGLMQMLPQVFGFLLGQVDLIHDGQVHGVPVLCCFHYQRQLACSTWPSGATDVGSPRRLFRLGDLQLGPFLSLGRSFCQGSSSLATSFSLCQGTISLAHPFSSPAFPFSFCQLPCACMCLLPQRCLLCFHILLSRIFSSFFYSFFLSCLSFPDPWNL